MANKKGAPLESAGGLGTPSKTSEQDTIFSKKIQGQFWEREARTIEAEALMALVRRIIEPDGSEEVHDFLSGLGSLERYGLAYVCDTIAKSMAENHTAMCDCHERGKVVSQ